MKKKVLSVLILCMMLVATGCSTTKYQMEFDGVEKIEVKNGKDEKQITLDEKQKEECLNTLKKPEFDKESARDTDEYAYLAKMYDKDGNEADLIIYDSEHIKLDQQSYVAYSKKLELDFFEKLFE